MNGDHPPTHHRGLSTSPPLSVGSGISNTAGLLKSPGTASAYLQTILSSLDPKRVLSGTIGTLFFLLLSDSLFSKPEHRIIQPDASQQFLGWVERHPAQGVIWILLLMSVAIIFMIPIGTPLTVGCGYIYKGAYGWRMGVLLATIISMAGSALGAVACFLLGRYLMRQTVRKWIRKYPLFDAIDIASEQHGLRIMAMLYLTPILPLGPVSYMCGTTSMTLTHFVLAKIAALPLMMLYVFMGASAGTLLSKSNQNIATTTTDAGITSDQVRNIEENEKLVILGLVLSAFSIGVITTYIKKELNKILEQQKRQKDDVGVVDSGKNMNLSMGGPEIMTLTSPTPNGGGDDTDTEEANLELGNRARQRKH
jgi:uncharacterized membrane protein YdjX (TVP38/TMEM64 family)